MSTCDRLCIHVEGCDRCTFWLVERGQPEGQVPTVWWGHSGWWETVTEAEHYRTREAAQAVVERQFTPPPSRGGPIARAVEHSWLAVVQEARREPLDVERLARAIGDSGAARNIAWPVSWHNEATYAWLARSIAAEYARLAAEEADR